MRDTVTRATGLIVAVAYSVALAWLFAAQPPTIQEALGGIAAEVGIYAVDAQAFEDGLTHFRADRFSAARTAFARADPARRDARTQFYIAYSLYREGWHRSHSNDALYKQGLETVERAIALAPSGRLVAADANLKMQSAEELKAELERGLRIDSSDFNPMRLLEPRK
jgi:tetratricopeptide (TPR) repeat protein